MDNSLTLARHFARLVWLLVHESQSTRAQKASLRAAVLVAKNSTARLGRSAEELTVNGLIMPQALSGVREVAERLAGHTIQEVVIQQGATAAELLSLARMLVIGTSSTSDAAEFKRLGSELTSDKVQVRMADGPAAAAPLAAAARAVSAADTPESRVEQALARLSAATTTFAAISVLDELASAIAQACREGRTGAAADLWTTLLEREAKAADPDLRRAYALMVRGLTRPTILRAVAGLLATEPARGIQIERILERCGRDGAEVLVDQFSAAPTGAGRRVFHDALFRLPHVTESLVEMLADSRWHVARQAADLLGELKSEEAERALAGLLSGGQGDERARRAAARALGRFESSTGTDALARGVHDPSSSVRLETVAALASRKGTRAGAALVAAIDQENDTEVQYAILAALGRVATPEGVQKLVTAAAAASGLFKQKKNTGLRVAAVVALREARTAAALSALKGLANDKEKDVKDAVMRALSAPSAAYTHARG